MLDLRVQDSSAPDSKPPGPHVVAYCVISGGAATTAGTALGLAFSGSARITAWSVTIACVSVLAGLAYGSTAVNAMWDRCRHLLRRAAAR
jgi:hypothetical protein